MTEISKKSGIFLGKLVKKVAKLLKFQKNWPFFLEKSRKKLLNDSNDQGVNFLGRPKVAHIEPYLKPSKNGNVFPALFFFLKTQGLKARTDISGSVR